MRPLRVVVILFCLVFSSVAAIRAQDSASPAEAIRAKLDKQVADWNRGDLDAFATGYKNSPDILFMGTHIYKGYAAMLARYREAYPTRETMGTLSFSQLEVQPLSGQFATVTGHFHLTRASAGGGDANGYFLLVCEKTKDGWKIVRDDSTSLPK